MIALKVTVKTTCTFFFLTVSSDLCDFAKCKLYLQDSISILFAIAELS